MAGSMRVSAQVKEKKMSESPQIDALNYEQAFQELQAVISLLEAGEKPLDETLALYARGQALYQRCLVLLEEAELKVEQLNQAGDLSPFEE